MKKYCPNCLSNERRHAAWKIRGAGGLCPTTKREDGFTEGRNSLGQRGGALAARIQAYVAADNPVAVAKVMAGILKTARVLRGFSEIGHKYRD